MNIKDNIIKELLKAGLPDDATTEQLDYELLKVFFRELNQIKE